MLDCERELLARFTEPGAWGCCRPPKSAARDALQRRGYIISKRSLTSGLRTGGWEWHITDAGRDALAGQ